MSRTSDYIKEMSDKDPEFAKLVEKAKKNMLDEVKDNKNVK